MMVKQKRKPVVISDDEEGDDDDSQRQYSQGSAKSWAKLPFSTSRQEYPEIAGALSLDTSEKDASTWAAKYAPRKLADLLVHSKKVSEVRAWLENKLGVKSGSHSGAPPILLLVGPPGVGKSSVVQVLANVIGFELCEWTTPVPTLWQEHLHNAVTRSRYVSKLDEFEAFLSNARKYPSLAGPARGGGPSQPGVGKVLLIDDFPMASAVEEKQRLLQALRSQLFASHFPCVVVLSGARGDMNRVMLEIQQTLEWGGATSVSFNPLTTSAIQKFLLRVSSSEGCKIPLETVCAVAENSDGDVRSALSCLHFLCVGSQQNGPGSLGPGAGVKKMKGRRKVRTLNGGERFNVQTSSSVSTGRDCSLALFHALGKFLYNKRLPEQTLAPGDGSGNVCCGLLHRYARLPLDMEEPETILARASTDSGTVLAFLQENVVDFIHEEAIDDVADVMGYFSDSDFLLGAHGSWKMNRSFSPFLGDEHTDAWEICAAAAGSVASRGLLFGNAHSAPRKWQALRSPSLWQVEKDIARTRAEIWAQRLASHGSPSMTNATAAATEMRPFYQRLRLLSSSYSHIFEAAAVLVKSRPSWDNGFGPGDDDEVGTQYGDRKMLRAEAHCYRDMQPASVVSISVDEDDEIEDW